MANYYLKYYAEVQNFRGQLARVEIHQREPYHDTPVLQIGDVCGLELEIQGGQDDLFTPVIKTQLRLSMVSSDDKPTADGIKYGGWQEFYTPDATLYKVVLKTKPTTAASSWTTRWSGYITPDSWSEGLDYRDAITITARDNIGHLQDFEFDMVTNDANGLATIRSVVSAAMAKVSMPMTFSITQEEAIEAADGTVVLDAMVVLSEFQGKDWFSVLEGLLDSIGYTLRFVDYDTVYLAPMRYLPLLGFGDEQDQPQMSDLEFFNGSGEVVPAVKKITETHDYDYNDEVPIPVFSEALTFGQTQYYECKVDPQDGQSASTHWAPFNKLTGASGTAWQTGSDMINPALYTPVKDLKNEGVSWNKYAFLAANGTDSSIRNQTLSFACGTPDVTLRMVFARYAVMTGEAIDGGQYIEHAMDIAIHTLYRIRLGISFTKGGVTRYWDKSSMSWTASPTDSDFEFDSKNERVTEVEIPLGPDSAFPADGAMGGTLAITFNGIWFKMFYFTSVGVYARLASLTMSVNASNLARNTVRTINDEKNNILIEREPMVAPLSREVTIARPDNYPSALFYYKNGAPAQYPYRVNWHSVSGVVKPLPVLIHQQILCYRGGSLWELNGECAPKNKGLFWFNSLCHYKNRTYILQSGTLDFLTGNVVGAILREFLEYDSIWDDTQQGDWTDETIYDTRDGNSYGGGSGSSGGGGGGTGGGGTVTSVAVSVPTGFTVSGSPITTNGTIAISLATGYTIPLASDVQKGVDAYGWGDHAQAGYLTSITGTMVVHALGYVPANGKDAFFQAPRLLVRRGINREDGVYDRVEIGHPFLASSSFEVVLMVYRGHNGRMSFVNQGIEKHWKYKKGWAVAMGNLEVTGHTAFTKAATASSNGMVMVTFSELREFIIKRFMYWYGYTAQQLFGMTYSDWVAGTETRRGFHKRQTAHGSCYLRFGIAVRYENPAFAQQLVEGHTLNATTQQIGSVPRYIYSAVAPLEAFLCNKNGEAGKYRRYMDFGVLWK